MHPSSFYEYVVIYKVSYASYDGFLFSAIHDALKDRHVLLR